MNKHELPFTPTGPGGLNVVLFFKKEIVAHQINNGLVEVRHPIVVLAKLYN